MIQTKPDEGVQCTPLFTPALTLSDAIRLGARKGKQLQNELVDDFHPDIEIPSCALGAALLGAGEACGREIDIPQLRILYPELTAPAPSVPLQEVFGYYPYSLEQAISHLNDVQGWTREEIADWCEKLP